MYNKNSSYKIMMKSFNYIQLIVMKRMIFNNADNQFT